MFALMDARPGPPVTDPARWERVKEIFQAVFDRLPNEREAFLRQACGGDVQLEGEVERLLQAHGRAEGFLAQPAGNLREPFPPEEDDTTRPAKIGPYRILRTLGSGGMGTVYLAERDEPGLHRTVAIKLVRHGMEAEFVLRRFHTERQILASLEHPGVARLYDGGSTEDGLPYFVMEYVEGENLFAYCEARRLSVTERLQLFRRVCGAVQYAHQNLVVHRDLKPWNILVTAEENPKLLDFGIGKLLQPRQAGDGAEETATLQRLMTADYASPEQVRGERVTTASDVYALGVVLYELLTGQRPYRLTSRRPEEVARAVCEEEPIRPSRRVTTGGGETVKPEATGRDRRGDRRRLRQDLKGDLDSIVLKALRKEPEKRYASVEVLSDDVTSFLDGRPVRARRGTFAYRTGKFVRRHRISVAAAALVAVLLVAALVTTLRQARIARDERAAAQRHLGEVRELTNAFLFEFHDAIRDLPGSTPARELVVRRALEYLEKLSRARSADPGLSRELAEAYQRISKVQGGLFGSHLGDTAGAKRSLEKALAIRRLLARSEPASREERVALAATELDLAQVLVVAGEARGAVESSRRATAIFRSLAAAHPEDRALAAGLARAERYLGMALSAEGDIAGAAGALRSAVRAFDRLSAAGSSRDYRRELAISHQILIHVLPGTENTTATESYRAAVEIQEALILGDPGNAALHRELSYTQFDMGFFRERRKDFPGALEAYGKAVRILESLASGDPRNAEARLLLGAAYNSLGYAQARTGVLTAAAANLSRSLGLLEPLASSDPTNVPVKVALARLYDSFGTAAETEAQQSGLGQRIRLEEAREWYSRSERTYAALRERGRLSGRGVLELDAVAAKLSALDRLLSRTEPATNSKGGSVAAEVSSKR